jgi:tetratricopeptide (TPR) repeat protein
MHDDQPSKRAASRRAACFKYWKRGMGFGAKYGVVAGAAVMLILPRLESRAAQVGPVIDDRLKNIQLCNQSDRNSPDARIKGCTALINGQRKEPKLVLAIAYNNRGNAYSQKGNYDRAIKDYDLAIQINPTYAKPYNNRGVAYQNKGDYNKAIRDFDVAIKLSPDYAYALANRAETFQIMHDYERALRDYDNAIRADPNLKEIWNGRCWARAIIGQLHAALTDCNRALSIRPNAATYDSRGLTYLKLGQYDLAIEDYSSALRLDPRLADALYGRGIAKLKKGDTTGGKSDIAAAKALKATITVDFSRYGIK